MAFHLKYFVLRPGSKHSKDKHAQASREAMRSYADEIEDTDSKFAEEIRVWVAEESHKEKKLKERETDELAAADSLILREIENLKRAIIDKKE